MALGGLLKPEYLLRPRNVIRRLRFRDPSTLPQRMTVSVRGRPIVISPREVIGGKILHFGLFDLLVTEALMRLAEPGDLALDIGANIGFMTRVLADAVGPEGRVIACEPHPEIFADLTANCREAQIELHQTAVSDRSGTALLHVPARFAENRGIASLEPATDSAATLAVNVVELDRLLPPDAQIGVVKLDIEGHELAALRGAKRLLAAAHIRDLVFEEHDITGSPVFGYLGGHGYSLFRLEKRFFGPRLRAMDDAVAESSWESPCFLATCDPDRARRIFASGGWSALART